MLTLSFKKLRLSAETELGRVTKQLLFGYACNRGPALECRSAGLSAATALQIAFAGVGPACWERKAST